MDKFAVHLHVIALAGLDAEVGARLSVEGDASGLDQLIAMTARADAGGGEETVKTHRTISSKDRCRSNESCLGVRFRFGKADDFAAFLPLRALLEKFDALKAFQDIALGRDGAGAF
jgi:hypothetical protein